MVAIPERAVDGYRTPGRVLHWVVALVVLATIPAGLVMIQEGLGRGVQNTLFIFHKNVGVLILLLMVVRIAYRAAVPAPALPGAVPLWQRRAARVSHTALYLLVVFMAVTGYVRVRAGGFPIEALDAMGVPTFVPRSDALAETAKAAHHYGRTALIAVIAVHVGAAAYHAGWRRDGVVARMWPPVAR